MATETRYLQNDNLVGYSGHYDLLTTADTGVLNVSTSNTAFVLVQTWSFPMGNATIDSTSVNCSVAVSNLSGTLEFRWRLVSYNSSGTPQATSSYSGTYTTAGTKTETLTFNPTMAAGYHYGIEIELRRSGGHGTVSMDVDTTSSSYIIPDYTPVAASRPRMYITH